ncbi:hypothetical protein QBC40DRAFT_289880, partial [Triangularia verruculosa]
MPLNADIFTEIINLAQISEATDPRDKVYGILALLPDAIRKNIQPHYADSYTAFDAYTEFSRACILGFRALTLCAHGEINMEPPRLKDSSLPARLLISPV